MRSPIVAGWTTPRMGASCGDEGRRVVEQAPGECRSLGADKREHVVAVRKQAAGGLQPLEVGVRILGRSLAVIADGDEPDHTCGSVKPGRRAVPSDVLRENHDLGQQRSDWLLPG